MSNPLHAAAMAAKSFADCALFALDYPDSVTARDTLPACREALEKALAAIRSPGECICPKCGIRHGGSGFVRGEF